MKSLWVSTCVYGSVVLHLTFPTRKQRMHNNNAVCWCLLRNHCTLIYLLPFFFTKKKVYSGKQEGRQTRDPLMCLVLYSITYCWLVYFWTRWKQVQMDIVLLFVPFYLDSTLVTFFSPLLLCTNKCCMHEETRVTVGCWLVKKWIKNAFIMSPENRLKMETTDWSTDAARIIVHKVWLTWIHIFLKPY
jgi:hypothetical protein